MGTMSREQKLIDLTFEITAMISNPIYSFLFAHKTQEERMDWVATQLRSCGFDTQPIGSSWGVLINTVPSDIAQLMKFYSVDSIEELVKMQAHHVERLQEKLPKNDMVAVQHVRA